MITVAMIPTTKAPLTAPMMADCMMGFNNIVLVVVLVVVLSSLVSCGTIILIVIIICKLCECVCIVLP